MPETLPDSVAQLFSHCQAGREEIASALRRAFGEQVEVSIEEPILFGLEKLPDDVIGPGLALAFAGAEASAILLLPDSQKLLPVWYASPDAPQQAQLTTLAQELAKAILPDSFAVDKTDISPVKSLADIVRGAKLLDGAQTIGLSMSTKSGAALARFIWPVAAGLRLPDMFDSSHMVADEEPSALVSPNMTQSGINEAYADLPPYTRSLLHIRVPISVTLATKRQPIGQILDLGAGSIIHFEKSCEEMLDLFVGEHRVAKGEAVKVGEKFGLRITSVILPEERFKPVNGN
jgi:flagellar motor switch protein FliN/FliY